MTQDRHPMEDKNLYGAEDDEELDAIYRAMERFEAEQEATATGKVDER